MLQTKEQGKNLQDQINEEEIGNLPEKEFRVMRVKMIQNLRNRMEAQIEKIQEIFNKDLVELKNKQTVMNNTIIYKGIPIRLSADFSAKTLQARREWQDIFKVMKEKNLQPRLLYPAWISFRFDREIKSFTDKQKLRQFSTTKPALQQTLKELL